MQYLLTLVNCDYHQEQWVIMAKFVFIIRSQVSHLHCKMPRNYVHACDKPLRRTILYHPAVSICGGITVDDGAATHLHLRVYGYCLFHILHVCAKVGMKHYAIAFI